MGISSVRIKNYNSIKDVELDLSKYYNFLIGKNGGGKTTIISAIKYFYKHAKNPASIEKVNDKKNPYGQKTEIEIKFDFETLYNREHQIKDIDEYEKYILDNRYLIIKLTQYKSGKITWYPVNSAFSVRKILKLFPVFAVDTRKMEVNDWSGIWEIVSEIAIPGTRETSENIKEKLSEAFSEIYGKKYKQVLEIIEDTFERESININKNDYKKRFKYAILSNLEGDLLEFDNQNIEFNSAGTNSLKYLKLYVGLLSELTNTSVKESMVIIDEPEIGLHPQYIDELVEALIKYSGVKYLISTHSSHFLSTLIRETASISFYQVYYHRGNTYIKAIKEIIDENEKYLVTDNEAESYFANGLIFVEGQTEIQIFKNRNIMELYPTLKRLTFYNTGSTDNVTQIIVPSYCRSNIPYLILLDMDKILSFKRKEKIFKIKAQSFNPLSNKTIEEKEKYYFRGAKYNDTYLQRRRIKRMLEYEYSELGEGILNISCNEYKELIKNIKKYCVMYNTYPLRTTIEGALISEASYDIFLQWLKEDHYLEQRTRELEDDISEYSDNQKVSILRCIFHGKLDTLENVNENEMALGKNVEDKEKSIIDSYSKGKKVDGWITSFFRWYFERISKYSIEEKKRIFEKDFPELADVVKHAEDMVKFEK